MAIINLPNGIGELLGDQLGTGKPLIVNGNVWYVSSVSGLDGASPAGLNHSYPLATLQQAVTNSANGDIIVLLPDHNETVTSTVTINKCVAIVGAGMSSGYPTAILKNNQANDLLSITATGPVQIRNIWFDEHLQAGGSKIAINVTTGMQSISNCYFEEGQYNLYPAIAVSNSLSLTIKNCTFISTATTTATAPAGPIYSAYSGTVFKLLTMDGVVIDGGVSGWNDTVHATENAITLKGTKYPDYIAIESLSLLRGSDILLDDSSVGYLNTQTNTGGCRVEWS